jgi:hypothetical protein
MDQVVSDTREKLGPAPEVDYEKLYARECADRISGQDD